MKGKKKKTKQSTMYAIDAVVSTTKAGVDGVLTTLTTHLPTFYLDVSVQGITGPSHAKKIAESIVQASHSEDSGVTVSITAVPVTCVSAITPPPTTPLRRQKPTQLVNGVLYYQDTPDEVIAILEKARKNKWLIYMHYGHTSGPPTGCSPLYQDWLEENDVRGYIGCSMGPQKVPLLMKSPSSEGGPAILDNCIIRIRREDGADLYRHPKYHHGKVVLRAVDFNADTKRYRASVTVDGTTHANFVSMTEARTWLIELGLTYTEDD